ncbi:MAG: hypothetical protein FWG02_02225 [Holophagaceae bacterium]|nr:hypothetical protein [Holophagaceae bacterium]
MLGTSLFSMRFSMSLLLSAWVSLFGVQPHNEGNMGSVRLITDREIEIQYSKPVSNDAEAKAIFEVFIDAKPLATSDWEYLSFFNFGQYKWAENGGVVNIRLKVPLDASGAPLVPLGRQRVNQVAGTNTYLTHGQSTAKRVEINCGKAKKIASWKPFYGFSQIGHMSRLWVWGSATAGMDGVQLNNSTFSASIQRYDAMWVTDMLGEGINRFVGRAEYLNIPMVDANFRAVVVGPSQSVYEAPEYRELYNYKTMSHNDIYNRRVIHGTREKAVIVTTADDVMRHDSEVCLSGSKTPARTRTNFFYFAEAFFRLYYQLGVMEGCLRYPLSGYNRPDDYRYDFQIRSAFVASESSQKWPGTVMRKSAEDYYVYGAMVHFELVPESEDGSWQATRFPVNTRAELESYDNKLYVALSGIHGKYEYFSGTADAYVAGSRSNAEWGGWGQGGSVNASMSNDVMKKSHPWFWRSQVDNFGIDGKPYSPLAIEHVHVISDSQIEIKFNREVSTITAVTNPKNWKVYLDGVELTNISEVSGSGDGIRNDLVQGGYAWQAITLNTGYGRTATNFGGTSTKPIGSGHDKPLSKGAYGRGFNGFTSQDIAERKVSNDGWIANNMTASPTALKRGEFVDLMEATKRGAGLAGVISVEFTGTADPVKDWGGNILAKGQHKAEFMPWVSSVYRSPLTGYYIYADGMVKLNTLKAGAYYFDLSLANNSTITYQKSAGGADFPAHDPNYQQPFGISSPPADYSGLLYLHKEGTTYDRVGQRIADGAVANGGGMQIVAGSVYAHHPAKQPTHRGQIGVNFHNALYVEGWGGNTFQCEDVNIWKELNLNRYKNESLFYHEGGHGIDAFTQGSGRNVTYARNVYDDITSAWLTAVHQDNGRRWHDVNEVRAYCGQRGEYISVLSTHWHGTERESFLGINDGTWTPVNTREELLRYDPYGFEVHKRIFFNGDLGLWYENRVGDPDYRVIPEDWELLKEQNEEFSHWTSVDNLIAWGATVPETARHNPYTGERNPLINWVSWNTPNVWNIGLKESQQGDRGYPSNKFDFIGRDAYNPNPDGSSPTVNGIHPFLRKGGVKKPIRPAHIYDLVKKTTVSPSHFTDITMVTPVLIQFTIHIPWEKRPIHPITMNNAPTNFDVIVDDKLVGFSFWSYEPDTEISARVTLRLNWPLEEGAKVDVRNFGWYFTARSRH